MDSGCVAIAYETVTGANGRGLALLAPMSEIAGRLSTLVGSYYLQKHCGGTGRLISGVPGVLPAKVLIIGGVSPSEQLKDIENGVDIVVATPGRIDDFISSGKVEN